MLLALKAIRPHQPKSNAATKKRFRRAMKNFKLSQAIILGFFTIGLVMPLTGAKAADPAAYKSCVRSCQQQYAVCYKNTKNRAQCQAEQANCSQGCASYLSSLKNRVLAMISSKKD